jgi:hypothetical protein
VKARPTTYGGVQFRSRLEARWAAFFDCMGWRWEYEPFEGNNYIPDFVLLGNAPVAVEVKPATSVDELRQYAPKVTDELEGVWHHDIALVGLAPLLGPCESFTDTSVIGLLLERYEPDEFTTASGWVDGGGVWMRCNHCGLTTFHHDHMWYQARICGHADGDHHIGKASERLIRDAWATAANATQWKSPA